VAERRAAREADGSSAPWTAVAPGVRLGGRLEESLGSKATAAAYRAAAGQLRQTIRRCTGRREAAVRGYPAHTQYSQHANVLAVLSDVSTGAEARDLVSRVIADTTLTQCSYYFRHYLNAAVNRAGEGDRYLDLLGEWRPCSGAADHVCGTLRRAGRFVAVRLPRVSASPNFEIFRTVLGIDTAAPGFGRVRIRPFLGTLERVSGSIPIRTAVSVRLERAGPG